MMPVRERSLGMVQDRLQRAVGARHAWNERLQSDESHGRTPSVGNMVISGLHQARITILERTEELLTPESQLDELNASREQIVTGVDE